MTIDIPAEKNPRNIKIIKDGVNNFENRVYMTPDGHKGTIPANTWRDAERMAKHLKLFKKN